MQDASWLLMTWAAFNQRVQKRKSSSTGRKAVREGRKGRSEAEKSNKNPDWAMDGNNPCDSPFVTFYNKIIVLFLCFITGLGQSGPKGNSQTWHWIWLGSNQRRTGSKQTGANGEHGSSDASLFQGWFWNFFFSSPGVWRAILSGDFKKQKNKTKTKKT